MTVEFPKPIERLGVIGDPHAEDLTLEAALEFFRLNGIEDIVCTGDVVTGQGNAERCCQLLRSRNIPTVRGNHDRWLIRFGEVKEPHATRLVELSLESVRWLTDLPSTIDLPTVAGPALLCHGLGSDDMAGVHPQDDRIELHGNKSLWRLVAQDHYRFVINGHTHHRMVRKFANTQRPERPLTIINAGTLRRDHRPGLVVIDFRNRIVKFWSFELGELIEEASIPMS